MCCHFVTKHGVKTSFFRLQFQPGSETMVWHINNYPDLSRQEAPEPPGLCGHSPRHLRPLGRGCHAIPQIKGLNVLGTRNSACPGHHHDRLPQSLLLATNGQKRTSLWVYASWRLPRVTMGSVCMHGQVNSGPVCFRHLLDSCVLAAVFVPHAMGEFPHMQGTMGVALPG